MIRINLLPPEIGQKRRDERRWRWVIAGAVAVVIVLALVFLGVQYQIGVKQEELASVQQQAAGLQQQAERFKVFQVKLDDLKNRQRIAGTALKGRVDWSSLLYDVALVLPNDVYLIRVGAVEPKAGAQGVAPQAGKLTLDGHALDYPNDVPDLGYKSVAKLLVRLADLKDLASVWLGSSSRPAQAPSSGGTLVQTDIIFNITADIPDSSTASTKTP